MMGKARELQSKMGELQESLKDVEATGEAGAGAVRATLNGQMHLVNLTIDPSMMTPGEAEIVEDLVVAAVADARAKVEGLVAEKTQGMMGEFGLPPGMKLPFGMG